MPMLPISATSPLVVASVLALVVGACGVSSSRSAVGAGDEGSGPSRFRAGEGQILVGGIQVNEPSLEGWVDALERAGLDTVAVTDYAKQGDWDSANLWWDEEKGEVAEIRAAEAAGLHTVLVLRVALDHAFERNRFLWHGMIMPETDDELREWFRRYERFAVEWARIAEEEGIDALFVASEMSSLTSTTPVADLPDLLRWYLDEEDQAERRRRLDPHAEEIDGRHLWVRGGEGYDDLDGYLDSRIGAEVTWARQFVGPADGDRIERLNRRRALLEERWRALVAAVRSEYRGPVGYAANFDQYDTVGFWDALDVMGINAYFPLRRDLEVGPGELLGVLREGWSEALEGIVAFRRERGLGEMPVMFTEIGYTRKAGSTIEPWTADGFALVEETTGSEDAGGGKAEPGSARLVVWREQPEGRRERALAVRALFEAHSALPNPILEGLLYWKLTTVPEHEEIEPFALVLGRDPEDPLLAELRRFLGEEPRSEEGR